jgi:hypothetical protein
MWFDSQRFDLPSRATLRPPGGGRALAHRFYVTSLICEAVFVMCVLAISNGKHDQAAAKAVGAAAALCGTI